jgi:hypothetical protein
MALLNEEDEKAKQTAQTSTQTYNSDPNRFQTAQQPIALENPTQAPTGDNWLQTNQNQEKATSPVPATQPVTATQPISTSQSGQTNQYPTMFGQQAQTPALIQQKQVQRKGTGFTNLNRIMQANQGNKLGQSVAGGVTGQVQNLQSGIRTSQNQFNEQAQKGRLDTQEAADKRSSVLGRFDDANYNPDESQFKVSSGLQSQYDTQKQTLTDNQQAAKTASDQQRAAIQARYDQDQAKLQSLKKAEQDRVNAILKARETDSNAGYRESYNIFGSNHAGNRIDQARVEDVTRTGAGKGLTASLGSLQGLLGAFNTTTAEQDTEITNKLANIESQYGEMSAGEKAQWIQSEKDRMVAENLPSDEEMNAFRKYQTGTYTGPKELQDYQTLIGKAQQTEDLGTLSRSSGGRQELLKQFVGGRDYTQGQRGLDEAVLGQDKTSLLQKAAKKALGSENTVSQANKVAGSQAIDFTNKASQFGEETRGQIQAARDPISQKIEAQMGGLTTQEAQRQQDFGTIQNILSGKDPKYANLDKTTQMGLALQSAMDAGYLSAEDAQQLVGPGGLVKRAQAMGLDANAMLAERMQSIAAQGIDRRAGATSDQEARISALDKLMGKTGTDVEFGMGQEGYTAGQNKFDMNSMRDFIMKSEAEKMKDPAYAAKMQQAGMTPLQQTVGGIAGSAQAGMDSIIGTISGGDFLNGGDSTARVAEGIVNTSMGSVGTGIQARNSILNAMLDNKIGDSATGTQIKKLLSGYQNLEQKGLGELTKSGMNIADGFRDLTQTGRLDQALAKLSGFDNVKNITGNVKNTTSKAINDVGRSISTAFGGGKTGNWATSDYGTTDATTGKKTKIGAYANKSSSDIMKQMLSQGQLSRTASYWKGGAEGSKAMNELLKYYQSALKRERG